jgi:hypothetical protein
LAVQGPAFFGKGLFQDDAGLFGRLYDPGPRDRQPSAIDRMRDGFLLYRGIHNDSLKFARM